MGKNKDNKKYNRKTIHLIHLKPLLKCFNRKNAHNIIYRYTYVYIFETNSRADLCTKHNYKCVDSKLISLFILVLRIVLYAISIAHIV